MLLEAELLLSRRDGNRRYYRANPGHPLFPDLRQLVLKTAGLRDVLAAALQDLPGIDVALVFGALANGTSGAASDFDLLVIGDTGLRARAPRLRPVAEQLGREINPVTMTAAEFARGRNSNPLLVDLLGKEKLFVKGSADELERLA